MEILAFHYCMVTLGSVFYKEISVFRSSSVKMRFLASVDSVRGNLTYLERFVEKK
eukprot:Awhi_evm1s1449